MRSFLLTILAAFVVLQLSACRSGHIIASPPLRIPTAAPITRGVVYGPAGQTIRHLDGVEAQRLIQLLAAGQPMRNVNPAYFRFQPISYSVGFSRGTSKKWSAQFYGKTGRVVMPGGAVLTYTRAQRREILRLVDPQKRWRY